MNWMFAVFKFALFNFRKMKEKILEEKSDKKYLLEFFLYQNIDYFMI